MLDNGAIYILDIQNFIGKGSSEADRKREYRQRIEIDRTNVRTNLRQISEKSPPEIEKELDKEIDNKCASTKQKRKRFVKPTISDIEQYCSEKNISINAQQFIDYYESNGWKVGRNSMKDWQATVRRWASNNYGKKKNSKDNAINVVKEVMEEYRNEQQGNDSSITIDVTDSVVY